MKIFIPLLLLLTLNSLPAEIEDDICHKNFWVMAIGEDTAKISDPNHLCASAGKRIIHLAAQYSSGIVLHNFLKKNPYIDTIDKDGNTALFYLLLKNSDNAKTLIHAGADVNVHNHDGDTPLHIVSDPNLTQALIHAGANIHAKNENGHTPLELTFYEEYANLDKLKVLIDAGADVNVHNGDGYTPLIQASRFGYVEILQTLIKAGAYVNTTTNDYKENALHWASSHKKNTNEIVKILIAAGIDINAKNKDGETPWIIAYKLQNHSVKELLENAGVKITPWQRLRYHYLFNR